MNDKTRNYKKYVITYPASWGLDDVMISASMFCLDEPRLLMGPKIAGLYMVGYCDITGFIDYIRARCEIWQGETIKAPKYTNTDFRSDMAEAVGIYIRHIMIGRLP